jgi:hypothetical protein
MGFQRHENHQFGHTFLLVKLQYKPKALSATVYHHEKVYEAYDQDRVSKLHAFLHHTHRELSLITC